LNNKYKPAFCSWSGGKDSCLALYHAKQDKFVPEYLLTMFIENGLRTRSHGLHKNIIEAQSESLRIPMIGLNSSWNDYEGTFTSSLKEMRKRNIPYGIFGDLDFDENKEWVEKVCSNSGIIPYHPLWKLPRENILESFLNVGFKAMIIAVKQNALEKKYLGAELTAGLIEDFKNAGIDICGELGNLISLQFLLIRS